MLLAGIGPLSFLSYGSFPLSATWYKHDFFSLANLSRVYHQSQAQVSSLFDPLFCCQNQTSFSQDRTFAPPLFLIFTNYVRLHQTQDKKTYTRPGKKTGSASAPCALCIMGDKLRR